MAHARIGSTLSRQSKEIRRAPPFTVLTPWCVRYITQYTPAVNDTLCADGTLAQPVFDSDNSRMLMVHNASTPGGTLQARFHYCTDLQFSSLEAGESPMGPLHL